MSNKVKDTDMKNHTYYFFNGIINMKSFDLSFFYSFFSLLISIIKLYDQ